MPIIARFAAILLIGLLAACQPSEGTPIPTNCVKYGKNLSPVCS